MLFSRVKETPPQDAPAIAPEVVPVSVSSTWADRVLADITRDAKTIQPESLRRDGQPPAPSAAVAAPTVDTTFRAAAGGIKPARVKPPRSKWVGRVTTVFLFALVSAFATGVWKHYGDSARQTIAEWTPLIAEFAPQFALSSSSSTDAAAPADQPATTAEQQTAADQASPPDTTTAAVSPSLDLADPIQSMQRDLAAMGTQIEQLKASIAELRASQPATSAIARTPEAKPAEVRPPVQAARPRVTAVQPPPPPRPAATPPLRRPPPVQASAAPVQLTTPPPPPAAPPPAQTADDGGPVVRPPMSLRWNGVTD